MTEQADPRAELDTAIDAIEGGYEFLLAYAAQGRRSDREGAAAGQGLRQRLQSMLSAMGDLPRLVRACAAARNPELVESCGAFFAALERDAQVAQGAVRLVLAQADISSQLVDNLNASIHLRAVLTDIFLVDEALKGPIGGQTSGDASS